MADLKTLLSWKESHTGYFERGRDAIGRFFAPFISEEPYSWIVNGGIKVKLPVGKDLVDCARQAWILLREDQPVIAAAKKQNPEEGYYYKTPITEEIKDWIAKTFHVITECEAIDLSTSGFKQFHGQMNHLFVFPNENTLVLSVFHELCDGIGLFYTLDNIADLMMSDRTPQFGNEGKNLTPPEHITVGLPDIVKMDELAEKALTKLTEHAESMPGISLRCADLSAPGKNSVFSRMTLTEEETADVIKKSDKLGFTVSQAVSAAIALAIRKYSDSPQDKNYVYAFPFDYRHLNIHP